MIKSEIIKIEFTTDMERIENILKNQGINPIRWAVVSVDEKNIFVNVSYKI